MTREHDLEIGSLLKDRWYLILKPVTDSDAEGFKVTAYDTTPMPDPNDEYLEAGVVAQQGIMELLLLLVLDLYDTLLVVFLFYP